MNSNTDKQQTGIVCVTLAGPSSVEATITSASATRHAIVRLRTKSVSHHHKPQPHPLVWLKKQFTHIFLDSMLSRYVCRMTSKWALDRLQNRNQKEFFRGKPL